MFVAIVGQGTKLFNLDAPTFATVHDTSSTQCAISLAQLVTDSLTPLIASGKQNVKKLTSWSQKLLELFKARTFKCIMTILGAVLVVLYSLCCHQSGNQYTIKVQLQQNEYFTEEIASSKATWSALVSLRSQMSETLQGLQSPQAWDYVESAATKLVVAQLTQRWEHLPHRAGFAGRGGGRFQHTVARSLGPQHHG